MLPELLTISSLQNISFCDNVPRANTPLTLI